MFNFIRISFRRSQLSFMLQLFLFSFALNTNSDLLLARAYARARAYVCGKPLTQLLWLLACSSGSPSIKEICMCGNPRARRCGRRDPDIFLAWEAERSRVRCAALMAAGMGGGSQLSEENHLVIKTEQTKDKRHERDDVITAKHER